MVRKQSRGKLIFREPEVNAGHPHQNPFAFAQKNWRISIRSKWYANRSLTTQHRFAVPSTCTRVWFANHSRAVRKPFGSHACTRLKMLQLTGVRGRRFGIRNWDTARYQVGMNFSQWNRRIPSVETMPMVSADPVTAGRQLRWRSTRIPGESEGYHPQTRSLAVGCVCLAERHW